MMWESSDSLARADRQISDRSLLPIGANSLDMKGWGVSELGTA